MRSPDSIRQVCGRILPYIIPVSFCVLCGEKCGSSNHNHLCKQCFSDLPAILSPCNICGDALSIKVSSNVCGSCLHTRPFYHKSLIPLEYSFPVSHLVKLLKYKDKVLVSSVLSQILLDRIRQDASGFPEIIIPVPLHPVRLMRRGFNQSALIAETISKELKIPLDQKSCRRIRNTSQQTGFDKSQRGKNIRNAFSVLNSFSAKHVAIVDDVVTTGSTVNELAKTLHHAGVEKIEVWACARTVSV